MGEARRDGKAYDYIIVGAGSAGCVLAHRLSADPGTSVLLLEAGGRDKSPFVKIPKGFGILLGDDKYTWHTPVRPIGPTDKVEAWARGKTLGGSSSINGMMYNRGAKADYDAMVELGNPEWGWDDILPVYREMERHSLGGTAFRGGDGPLDVTIDPERVPLNDAAVAAGGALGWRVTDDMNDGDDERIAPAARTILNGQRVSSARAFLHPVEGRENLTVEVEALVSKVIIEDGVATAVETIPTYGAPDAAPTRWRARKEVILSAGSLHTPKILQLSGIGPRDVLRDAGVPVLVDSPQVGRRMKEHRCVVVQARLKADEGYNSALATPFAQAVTGVKYLVTHKGPLAAGAYDVIGFLKTDPDAPRPDAQILFAPFSAAPYEAGGGVGVERAPGIQAIGFILRPDSEGTLAITTADPRGPLDIDPNFFATEHDQRIAAATFRAIRELFAQEPLASRIDHETLPGPAVQDDRAILDSALEDGYCGYHAVSTCAMGPDPDDVVDSRLRVRGVSGLRVVDCSVMPVMVSGNLNGPIMAMAWRAADLIREDAAAAS